MTDTANSDARASGRGAVLFAAAVFISAALVFLAEPMVAQFLLPRLGGAPAVWNTSLAFFQIALLVGYGYAHLLQRLGPVRRQMALHLLVLAAAGLALPLRVGGDAAQGAAEHPIISVLTALTLSVGAPFAALSATAPLLQAWFARSGSGEASRNPYALYAASNLGSLIALLAYPFAIQPLVGLRLQSAAWSLGYAAFAILVLGLAVSVWRTRPAVGPAPQAATGAGRLGWDERMLWVLLAAAPSSLLLGVTAHLTTDVASAPFLWVPPLALYLLTFVIAFQTRPLVRPALVLVVQAAAAAVCLWFLPVKTRDWLPLLSLHLVSFFLTALVCHQALAARRPPAGRLTEFYLLMSLGGVIGGAFNAFLAPVIFNDVWEYPLILVLAGLARPWGRRPSYGLTVFLMLAGLGFALFLANPDIQIPHPLEVVLVLACLLCAFLLRNRAAAYVLVTAAIAVAGLLDHTRYDVSESRRSFFGVVQLGQANVPQLGGPVRYMVHGSTLHGAEALDPAFRCTPLTYYAPGGPIAQVFAEVQASRPSADFGVAGLGTGTVATYLRAADTMRIFEIDPLVVRLAPDPSRFGFVRGCAKGRVSLAVGDARLSLEREPPGRFDLLLLDAFSSDSVPTHLLTVEAMRLYLRAIKPDGVVMLHLSNRNLELTTPAAAAIAAAGGAALTQTHVPPKHTPLFEDAGAIVVIAARTPEALAAFRKDPRWTSIDPRQARAWTDDYSNVLGALVRRFQHPR